MSIYLNADCMNPETGLPSFPDNHFDLAIVDPPYGIDFAKTSGGKKNDKKNWIDRPKKDWDAERPSREYFAEVLRVSRNQIIWGGNYFADWLPASRCWLIWDKMQECNGSEFEMAWTSFDTPAKAFRMARAQAYCGKGKFHPNQKPPELYHFCMKYAKQGDLILDTHVGSASSLVAFEEMGFEYVGYELDADYYRDSTARLERFRAQPKLFTGTEIFKATQGEQGTLFEL